MTSSPSPAAEIAPLKQNVFLRLLPITCAVFIGFLTLGLALPVLPLHIKGTLHLSAFIVGILAGTQFAASLLSRVGAGGYADTRGAKRTVIIGFTCLVLGGVVYWLSLQFVGTPVVSASILFAGRLLLGCGESFVVTGALSWGVGLVGPQSAGRVMAWVGIAMFGAFAAGAPLGTVFYSKGNFTAIAIATMLIPLLALLLIMPVEAVAPPTERRPPFYKVIGAVWLPGLGLACSSVGFGAITTFIALQFAAQGWGSAAGTFTVFGAAFIAARLLFGHLLDKVGGARVAFICVLIEAGGQVIIWSAATPVISYIGAALSGFGYSLAFPGFGIEAVRRAPPQSRGLAMGAYSAFFDLSLGLATPGLGLIANRNGVATVYLASAIAVVCGVLIAARLLSKPMSTPQASL